MDSLYLASVTAACMASSISCPTAACSPGMGTANRIPLWRPSDRVLAAWTKNTPNKHSHVHNLCVFMIMETTKAEDIKSWYTNEFCSLLRVADLVWRSESALWREEGWEILQRPISGYTDTLCLLIKDTWQYSNITHLTNFVSTKWVCTISTSKTVWCKAYGCVCMFNTSYLC